MDKIKGMIYGGIYGDVYGAPYEFRNHYPNDGQLYPAVHNSQFQGKRTAALGQMTDDSEMALVSLNHIIANNLNYDITSVVLDYLAWANSHMAFMGKNTRALFYGVKTLKGYRTRYEKRFPDDESKEDAQSNGATMRIYPLALLGFSDVNIKKIIKQDTVLTNPSQSVINANTEYVIALSKLLHDVDVHTVLSEVRHQPLMKHRDVTQNRGWYEHAIALAYYCLRHFTDFQSAMEYIISLGGDTDTNASIAGAMLGAALGYQNMKKNNVFRANMKTIKTCHSNDGDYPRPKIYEFNQFKKLINQLSDMI